MGGEEARGPTPGSAGDATATATAALSALASEDFVPVVVAPLLFGLSPPPPVDGLAAVAAAGFASETDCFEDDGFGGIFPLFLHEFEAIYI